MNIEKLPQSKQFLIWLFKKRFDDVEFVTPIVFSKENTEEKITGEFDYLDIEEKIDEGFVFRQASCLIKTENFIVKALFGTEPFSVLNIKILNDKTESAQESYKENIIFIRLSCIEEFEKKLEELYKTFKDE